MSTSAPAETVYQLRVVLAEVSPLIWRCVQVTGSTTLTGLHEVLQTAFGWDDGYLHEFTVYAVTCSTTGGAHRRGDVVRLADLRLREHERFVYGYNFFAGWFHDLRVEKIGPAEPRRRYPRCLASDRRVPPDGCDSPAAYQALRDNRPAAVLRTAEILGELLDADPGARLSDFPDLLEELRELQVYGGLDDFDRAMVNTALGDL